MIHALGFFCIVTGIIISVDFPRVDTGSNTGVREMPAQGAAHGDDRYKTFMDEIRRSHVDEQEDAHMDGRYKSFMDEIRKAHVDEQEDAHMDVPVRRTTKKKAKKNNIQLCAHNNHCGG